MSPLTLAIILIGCLLAEGFFSGSEIAIVNADKFKLALSTDAGSRWARAALHLVKHPALFFSTTLLGTNIFTVTGSVVTTLFIIHRFGEAYAPFAILYWPCTLVFGEIVPKSLYQHYADRIVMKVAPILLLVSYVFYPVVWLLAKFTDFLLGGVKKKFGDELPVKREDLETMMELKIDIKTDVRPEERTMISRIFDLEEKKVENIMTPLVDVVAIPVDSSRENATRILEESEFSRVPVYDKQLHNILGVLTGSDLLFSDVRSEVRNLATPAFFVPEEMPLDNLLVTMKRKGEPMAIVVDEYGAATGIVTTEDLLEEIVGEIRDEHDEIRPLYKRLGHRRFLVDGRMEIEHANERMKLGIEPGEYETIAGYLIHHFERIPERGDKITIGRFQYIVHRASDRAVHEIEILEKGGS
jgi:CBS domain containing-hemolysin-like protein